MDQSRPSPEHRLKRKALWATLWLAKLIRFMPDLLRLPRRARAFVGRRLDVLADFVINLVVIRAAHQFRPVQRQRNRFAVWRAAQRHDVRARHVRSLRAAIGGNLRRALKARGLKARAEAILRALQNLDRLLARFLRRMKKGLSRRMSAHTRALDILPHCRAEAASAKAGPAPRLREEWRAAVAPP